MAYLLKAKKNIEEQDINEFKVKKEKYLARRKQKKELKTTAETFDPSNNYDGNFIPPILQKHNDKNAFIRYAEYVGTFTVQGMDQAVRAEFVRRQLNLMKVIPKTRGVLIIISTGGVKVTDKKGQSLLMAHATHRISYSTCVPQERLFCFISREPKGPISIHYCHVFTASKTNQVEELNTILGNAFKEAHSAKKTAPVSFNKRIAEKLEEQREIFEEVQQRNDKELAKNKKVLKDNQSSSDRDAKGKIDKAALEKYSWFKPNMQREQIVDHLLRHPVGSFVVRESTTYPNCFTLSVRVNKNDNPACIVNYLIEQTADGVKVKGLDKEWSSIIALVSHHSIMPELLPIRLKLPEQKTKGK